MELILASQSPRRVQLLKNITENFSVCPAAGKEVPLPGASPQSTAVQLALQKALEISDAHPDALVIGADTVVSTGSSILGKPKNKEHCLQMLASLSGKEHLVCTGVALVQGGKTETFCAETAVEFFPLTPAQMEWYASTPEPYDKAGGYGIQGLGSLLVKQLRGDYFNVMGLPVAQLAQRLSLYGFCPW